MLNGNDIAKPDLEPHGGADLRRKYSHVIRLRCCDEKTVWHMTDSNDFSEGVAQSSAFDMYRQLRSILHLHQLLMLLEMVGLKAQSNYGPITQDTEYIMEVYIRASCMYE